MPGLLLTLHSSLCPRPFMAGPIHLIYSCLLNKHRGFCCSSLYHISLRTSHACPVCAMVCWSCVLFSVSCYVFHALSRGYISFITLRQVIHDYITTPCPVCALLCWSHLLLSFSLPTYFMRFLAISFHSSLFTRVFLPKTMHHCNTSLSTMQCRQ